MGTAHSKIGASSMYRWEKCPGSVRLSEGIEVPSSPFAIEGTTAHEVAEKILLKEILEEMAREKYGDEMIDAVMVYVNTIEKESKAHESVVYIEERVNLSEIHKGLFGTSDAVIYFPKERLLVVYDYKHGAGLPVEVENNPQLLYYALGTLYKLDVPATHIETVVVQPRCPHPDGPVRRHTYTALEMVEFGVRLKAAALATEAPNARLQAGEHCRFCPASSICPLLREKANAMAIKEFSTQKPYDERDLSEALEWAPILEAWIKNLRDFAYGQATLGKKIPGWKLVDKRATRKWVSEKEAAKFLTMELGLGEDDMFTKKLKTPSQIEKVLKKEKKKISSLIKAESSGAVLVPESDKRAPTTLLTAKEVFDVVPKDDKN